MAKKYNITEENEDNEDNILREPSPTYGYRAATDMEFSPPLTEEELRDSITGKELLAYIFDKIDQLPDR